MLKAHQQKLQKILKQRLAKILFVPDSHHPYVDEVAWSVMLEAAKGWKPDIVVVLGDFIDCYQISAHQKDLKRRPSFEEEVDAGSFALKQLEDLKPSVQIYIEGNHENRLDRLLTSEETRDKLIPLIQVGAIKVQRIPDILKLKDRGWHYVDYKQHYKLGKLHVTHDCGKAGMNAHMDAEATFQSNAVIGHTHRLGYSVRGNMKEEHHVGAMFGWLGDPDQAEYMHRAKALREWAHGFGIGYMDAEDNVYLVPVPIFNGKCLVEGKIYTNKT
jgi:predicted phosphodiesterase